jgi:hypothetical protein
MPQSRASTVLLRSNWPIEILLNWVRKAGAIADCLSCSRPAIVGLQVSLHSSPVARFLASERDDLNSSPIDDIRCTDILSLSLHSKFPLDSYSDGFAEGRGACCPGDAVFSRRPNWVGRNFMFVRRPLQEPLLWLFRCCGCLCDGLPSV